MKTLAIFGASGHGKVLADSALLCGWESIVFFDDAWPDLTVNVRWPVLGDTKELMESFSEFDGVIVAIGNNSVRLEKTLLLKNIGAKLISLVHPNSIVSPFSTVGVGSFIGAGAVIQVDTKVGDACIINTNSVVEHDCVIGSGVHISPSCSLAGGVIVSDNSWIGIGASVNQLVTIGKNVIVGAGGVVIRNIPDELTVVGNPARGLFKK